jgi:hypothetical protein
MDSEVTRLPGQAEADAIAADYATSRDGIFAWIRMGIRLIDVKERLPHGEFTKWVKSNLTQTSNMSRVTYLSESQLYRAQKVANEILSYLAKQNSRSTPYTFDEAIFMLTDPNGQLRKIIEGKSQRQLRLEAGELQTSDDELAAQEWCEKRWEENPELRDEFEPRVLDGSLTYVLAKMGMTGIECTKGKPKAATSHDAHLRQAVASIKRHWRGYEQMDEVKRSNFVSDLFDSLKVAPVEVKRSLAKMLSE